MHQQDKSCPVKSSSLLEMPAILVCVETPGINFIPVATYVNSYHRVQSLFALWNGGRMISGSADFSWMATPLQDTVRCCWEMIGGSKITICNWQPI